MTRFKMAFAEKQVPADFDREETIFQYFQFRYRCLQWFTYNAYMFYLFLVSQV